MCSRPRCLSFVGAVGGGKRISPLGSVFPSDAHAPKPEARRRAQSLEAVALYLRRGTLSCSLLQRAQVENVIFQQCGLQNRSSEEAEGVIRKFQGPLIGSLPHI